jgi:hypothetical protein
MSKPSQRLAAAGRPIAYRPNTLPPLPDAALRDQQATLLAGKCGLQARPVMLDNDAFHFALGTGPAVPDISIIFCANSFRPALDGIRNITG